MGIQFVIEYATYKLIINKFFVFDTLGRLLVGLVTMLNIPLTLPSPSAE